VPSASPNGKTVRIALPAIDPRQSHRFGMSRSLDANTLTVGRRMRPSDNPPPNRERLERHALLGKPH
jgi:hypothetical protein